MARYSCSYTRYLASYHDSSDADSRFYVRVCKERSANKQIAPLKHSQIQNSVSSMPKAIIRDKRDDYKPTQPRLTGGAAPSCFA